MNDAREALDRIRIGSEVVTPGPWVVEEDGPLCVGWSDEYGFHKIAGGIIEDVDATHIALCDPDTMRAIARLVEELDGEIKFQKDEIAGWVKIVEQRGKENEAMRAGLHAISRRANSPEIRQYAQACINRSKDGSE